MKLQNLTVIFIIIILPIILLVSLWISTGLKTLKYQTQYETGLLTATYDAIYAFETNTRNSKNLSGNSDIKRNILKSSIKMFEKSMCSTCGVSAYNTKEIEEYIPAIVFGMYDGFYMYAPSYNAKTDKYEHNLKNYVYYSETLEGIGQDGSDVTIIYSLDNYVVVSGKFDGKYEIREGYLINNIDGFNIDGDTVTYKGIEIGNDTKAKQYFKDADAFSTWFKANFADKADFLNINAENDPEDENSKFTIHKRKIMKEKIEGVLNSSITAFSKRTFGKKYKMPKLSEEDWQKIYSDISMITFFQGKDIGLKNYNGYCVLNSTSHIEYTNPSLMYFISDDYYHNIMCGELVNLEKEIEGYKIGSFKQKKDEEYVEKKDAEGNTKTELVSIYSYDHKELACYSCVNGMLSNENIKGENGKIKTVYEYINTSTNNYLKTSYWTSLARERYNTTKLLSQVEIKGAKEITIQIEWNDNNNSKGIRKDKLQLNILEDGNEFADGKNIELSDSNGWKKTIKDLDIDSAYTLIIDESLQVDGYHYENLSEGNSIKLKYNYWLDFGDDTYHKCSECGTTEPHNWRRVYDGAHECLNCSKVVVHNYDSNGYCSVCKTSCTHSQLGYEDGKCKACGKECEHIWEGMGPDHWCEICNTKESHSFTAGNSKCNICNINCSHQWVSYLDGTKHCAWCGSIK